MEAIKKPYRSSKPWRDAHPMKYSYQTLRNNAKRRGKEFTITFEYFKRFCYRTKYIQRKGIYRDNYSLDRIDNTKGYVPGNLKVVTVSMNSSKGVRKVTFDYYRETCFYVA